jgi:hypothetical protein
MLAHSLERLAGVLRPVVLGVVVLTCAAMAQQTRTEQPAAPTQGVWQFEPDLTAPENVVASRNMPSRYLAVRLNPAGLDNTLGRLDRAARLGERQVFEVPLPDGTLTRLEVWEDSILGPELQARRPDIRTYSGRGIDDPSISARLDQTSLGFHGQLIGNEGTVLIDPLDKDSGLYMTFWKRDVPKTEPFECGVTRDFRDDPVHAVRHLAEALPGGSQISINPIGDDGGKGYGRRRYRLRIVTTFNYTNTIGFGMPDTGDRVAAAESQVATTVLRMDGIYEREVSIRFQLLTINALTGNTTDGGDPTNSVANAGESCAYPFANSPAVTSAFLTQNHDFLVCVYGESDWDVGHVFGAGGGGGLAQLGSVCKPTAKDGMGNTISGKGRGGTQLSSPTGDVFDVDYVSHEIGHQLNADHTFNNSCDNNRVAESAYEPGSGSTIMAYAGVCTPNVQSNSDDYFHTRSLDQMSDYAFVSGGLCGTELPSITTPPTVNAGPNRTIPQRTPFRLTATATGAATVNWDQYDLGDDPEGRPQPTNETGPMFRSVPPSTNFQRVFPRFPDILNPPSLPWEILPSVNREMTFRAIARDNIGGVRRDQMTVTVSGSPFEFTYPASGSDRLECAMPETITWNVGGGSIADNVAIKLSELGTPTIDQFNNLVASTPNDGSHTVTIPANLFNVNRRLMLEPDGGHVFFAVSRLVPVVDRLPPVVTAPGPITMECTGPGTPVELGLATAADACVGPLGTVNDAPALFPVGTTDVTWSATDPSNNTGTDVQQVIIEDTTPPTLDVSVNPTILWPANHRMVRIEATVVADDVCDPAPKIELVSITANEPDNSNGDGFTVDDVQGADFGTDDREFFLRAERRGMGTGRIYTITYRATDASGNSTTRQVFVSVPRDLGS